MQRKEVKEKTKEMEEKNMLNKAKNEDFFDVNQARERAREKTKGITLIALVITKLVPVA